MFTAPEKQELLKRNLFYSTITDFPTPVGWLWPTARHVTSPLHAASWLWASAVPRTPGICCAFLVLLSLLLPGMPLHPLPMPTHLSVHVSPSLWIFSDPSLRVWVRALFHFHLHQLLTRCLSEPPRLDCTCLFSCLSPLATAATSFLSAHLFVISLYNPWNPSTWRGLRKDCWIYEQPSTGPEPTASLVVAIPDLKEDIIRHVWSGEGRAHRQLAPKSAHPIPENQWAVS